MDRKSTSGAHAGILRRLAALAYDLVLVAALAFVATFALLPLSGGEALLVSTQGWRAHVYHALLGLAAFGYFGMSWTRSGQTLGMRAWRIELRGADASPLGWPASFARFLLGSGIALLAVTGAWTLRDPEGPLHAAGAVALLAPAVLNFAWIRIDPGRCTLLDLAGSARVRRCG